MKKKCYFIICAALLLVFLGSASMVFRISFQYQEERAHYQEATRRYTAMAQETHAPMMHVPMMIDFDSLQKVNDQIVGWLYCENSPINYPVLQGDDNDFYLHHAYDGTESKGGSIFVEAQNREAFQDANTILYGHHMKDDSMFGTLNDWANQAYYEAHPCLWLFTPQQNYRIELISGYTTAAGSDTYQIYTQSCEELNRYVQTAIQKSDFQTKQELDRQGKYVVLSTCAYEFADARYVLHGKLVPVP